MKMIIALAALVAVAVAAPQGQPPVVVVKESPLNNIGVDGYDFGYELSNGETRQETARVENIGTENESLSVEGSFSFIDPKTNVQYTVTYTADKDGFHPKGAHIPV